MTNDEIPNDERMTKIEARILLYPGIRSREVIRHLSFGLPSLLGIWVFRHSKRGSQ